MKEFTSLNSSQKEAILSVEKQTCVIAGPGCGKTRTLVAKVVHLLRNEVVSAETVLLLTFSKKAIREIRERICKQLGKAFTFQLNIHNFHSLCYKLLRENFLFFGFQKDFLVYDRNDQEALVKRILRGRSQVLVGRDFSDLMNSISLCKVRKNYAEVLKKSNYEEFLLYKNYEKVLHKEEGALDFNDLLLYLRSGLKNNKSFRETSSKFTNILVDEFQDVNDIQWEIVKLLANDKTKIFLVGDPNQSIYGFQGSSPHLISALASSDDWKKFFLSTNYRSTENIIKVANLFLEKNHSSLLPNQLESTNEKGEPVEIIRNCSPRFIVRKILYLVRNQHVKLSSIALLYRSNYLSSFIEQELAVNGIPYEILGSFKFIEREEIKDLLAYLKTVSSRNQNDTFFLRILKGLAGVGPKLINEIENLSREGSSSIFTYLTRELSSMHRVEAKNLKVNRLQEKSLSETIYVLNHLVRKLGEGGTLANFVNDLLQKSNYLEKVEQKANPVQRRRNIQQFLNLIRTWEAEQISKQSQSLHDILSDFLQYCSISFEDNKVQPTRNNLVLSSIHQVKGLEFDFVFFLYLDHNILPHKTSTDLAEEKRLFYVGITRAKKFLCLVSSSNAPSTFLGFLPEEDR